jgi:hypothetical protein
MGNMGSVGIKGIKGTGVGGTERALSSTRHIGGGARSRILNEVVQDQATSILKADEILRVNGDLLELGTDGGHFIFSLEKKNWTGTEE